MPNITETGSNPEQEVLRTEVVDLLQSLIARDQMTVVGVTNGQFLTSRERETRQNSLADIRKEQQPLTGKIQRPKLNLGQEIDKIHGALLHVRATVKGTLTGNYWDEAEFKFKLSRRAKVDVAPKYSPAELQRLEAELENITTDIVFDDESHPRGPEIYTGMDGQMAEYEYNQVMSENIGLTTNDESNLGNRILLHIGLSNSLLPYLNDSAAFRQQLGEQLPTLFKTGQAYLLFTTRGSSYEVNFYPFSVQKLGFTGESFDPDRAKRALKLIRDFMAPSNV